MLDCARIEWHGVVLDRPDWSHQSHSLAFSLESVGGRFRLHGMLNAYWEPLVFEIPPLHGDSPHTWRRCLDTALASPHDIQAWDTATPIATTTYVVQPRSMVLLALPRIAHVERTL